MRRGLLMTLALSGACALSGVALAEEVSYPSKGVRILVPFTAGTNADLVARLFAERLSERLKQPFVLENKAGAGGVLAPQALLCSQADGHTLMLVSSAHAANPSLNTQLPYDTLRDFTGIAMVGDSPTIIVAHPSLGVRTQADLVAAARNVPTASEADLQGFDYGIWYGLVASSGTPESVTRRLMAEMSDIVCTKEIVEVMSAQAITYAQRDGARI